jgi:hypothetical protein
MHVATAIRYGAYGFVTLDGRILNKAPAIAAAFNGFALLSPTAAVGLAGGRVKSLREYETAA